LPPALPKQQKNTLSTNDMMLLIIASPFFVSFCGKMSRTLNEIGNIHWHFLDLSGIELFNVTHHTDIVSGNKVDGNPGGKKVRLD